MTRVFGESAPTRWRVAAWIAALLVAATAPWWAPPLLANLSYFRVRRVEVYGRHYIQPEDVLARLRVDTTTSGWDDLDVLERRVASHPQIRSVTIERKLPGTLVVRITENLPVAFVPGSRGLRAVDADGHSLPIDPSRVSVDLPVLAQDDIALVRVLADLRGRAPSLYDQISTVRRVGRDEVTLALSAAVVRARSDVTAERLADLIPVEQDLARRKARVTELDLRFRDQVIARLQ